MGRSIRNEPKNIRGGGSTVSDAQLQTKVDVATVSAPSNHCRRKSRCRDRPRERCVDWCRMACSSFN